MWKRSWPFLLGAAVLLAAAFARAKDPELPSAFRRADVVVDGVADDWEGKLVPVAGAPLAVGIVNDASFVYVCVKTSDEEARKKILGAGLSVYLDASGKEDRKFGVRFPVGRIGVARPDAPVADDPKTTAALDLAASAAQLEVLGGEDADAGFMRIAEARPIEAALGDADGALVVELKVPLAFSVDSPHAVESAPGRTIALGLETVPPKHGAPGGDGGNRGGYGGHGGMGGGGMSGGMGGGGMGGGHGHGHGGAGREERNEAKSYGKPLRAWFQVPLAAAPR